MPIKAISKELVREISASYPDLKVLNLSSNELVKIENLEPLTCLTKLNVSSNKLLLLNNLRSLVHLKELYASDNRITCANLEGLENLEVLDLNVNQVERLDDLVGLRGLRHIKSLLLEGNPIADSLEYHQFKESRFEVVHDKEKEESLPAATSGTYSVQQERSDSVDLLTRPECESQGIDKNRSVLEDRREQVAPCKVEQGCQARFEQHDACCQADITDEQIQSLMQKKSLLEKSLLHKSELCHALEVKLEKCSNELLLEKNKAKELQSNLSHLERNLDDCHKQIIALTEAVREKSAEVQNLKSYIFTKGADAEVERGEPSSWEDQTGEEVVVSEECGSLPDRIRLLEMQLQANQEILAVQDKWMSDLERKANDAGKIHGWKGDETREVVNEFCTKMVKEWRNQVFALLLELKGRENAHQVEQTRLNRQLDAMNDEVCKIANLLSFDTSRTDCI
eukprot:760184-Hanusia_phi.AAC.3